MSQSATGQTVSNGPGVRVESVTSLPRTVGSATTRLPPRAPRTHDRGTGGRDLGRLGGARLSLRGPRRRGALSLRPLHLGVRREPTGARRLVDDRRARGSDDEARARHPRLAGDVPSPVRAHTLRRDGRRDLRRAHHARDGRRLDGARTRGVRLRVRHGARANRAARRAGRDRARSPARGALRRSKAPITDSRTLRALAGRTCRSSLAGARSRARRDRPSASRTSTTRSSERSTKCASASRLSTQPASKEAATRRRSATHSWRHAFSAVTSVRSTSPLAASARASAAIRRTCSLRYGERGPVGTVDRAIEHLKQIEELGYERVMLQHLAHRDLDTVALIGRELAPAVA